MGYKKGYQDPKNPISIEKHIDWMDVKEFRRRVKKESLEELEEECRQLDNDKKLMMLNIEECDKMLAQIEELENDENALFMENKLTPIIVGLGGGIFTGAGMGLAESLMNISVNSGSQIAQQAACAGAGILLGVAYYKARKEQSNEARKKEAMKKINAAKADINSKKVFYKTQIEVDERKKEIAEEFINKKTMPLQPKSKLFELTEKVLSTEKVL